MKQAVLSTGFVFLALASSCAPEASSFQPAPTAAPAPGAEPAGVTPQRTDESQKLLPTFASIKAHIFARSCLQCHAAGGRVGDIPLDTREAMLAVDGLVVAGKPDESDLVKVLTPGSGARAMPPRRANLPPVTSDELEVIREWILRGMP